MLVKAYKETNEYSLSASGPTISASTSFAARPAQLDAAGDKAALDQHARSSSSSSWTSSRTGSATTRPTCGCGSTTASCCSRPGSTTRPSRSSRRPATTPRPAFQCSLYIGRCFYEKGYHSQAVDTFREAIANYEIPDDATGKELHYWLGRSYEADGQVPEALKIYGQLIQWDYNYRDVRKRIDDLKGRP